MAYTLHLNNSAKPIGLGSVNDAVNKIAAHILEDNYKYGTSIKDLCSDKFQILASDENRLYRSSGGIDTPALTIEAPMIVMWMKYMNTKDADYLEVPEQDKLKVVKRVLFARDGFACQYCSKEATPNNAYKTLTVDHVKPVHMFKNKKEATTYENTVSACKLCNTKKGGLLPYQAKMYPKKTPVMPHYVQLKFAGKLNQTQRSYVADYFGIDLDKTIL